MASPNIEISNDFFHDSLDFLQRFRLTGDSFCAVKSKRLKLFLDLRMAAECVLKAYVAYFLPEATPREDAIRKIEKYSHKISKLATDTKAHLKPEIWAQLEPFIQPLDALPVGLRYRLDGSDFREVNEAFYYATVGSDDWLDELHNSLKAVAQSLDTKLQSHSRVVSVTELLDELMEPVHNKYAKNVKS